jgi:CubicO group peptidase (beta-lactamase class C family)
VRKPLLRSTFETLCRVYPADEVTSVEGGEDEVDPGEAGLDPDDVQAIWRAAVGAYRTGLYPALSICVRRRGKVVIDRAIGHVSGNAPSDQPDAHRVPATPQTLFSLFSASKMVTAMLIHLLDERRQLHLDDPVAYYIPEFGVHGKDRITIRHVLTHRAGIPHIPREFAEVALLEDPDRIIALLSAQKPTWVAGRRLAYHALTGGFVLAEIIRRVTGQDVRSFLATEILRPLGFRHFNYGVAPHELSLVAQNAFTGPPVVPPLSTALRRVLSVDFHEAVRASNDPRFMTAIVPAGNIMATAAETCRFMQLLLSGGELDGVRVFDPRTILRAVAEQTYLEFDLTLGLPIRYSMGFMLGARVMTLYGTHTMRAFGHLGFTNVIVYADPERDISVAIMTSGKPALSPGVTRTLWLTQTIARHCPRDWGRG